MPAPQNLQAKLDAYEATTRHHANAVTRRRRWSAYATAVGSSLAMATTAADADIIYSGSLNLTATQTKTGNANFKVDMDGHFFTGNVTRLVGLGGANNGGSVWLDAGAGGAVLENGTHFGDPLLGKLASGAKISGAGTFTNRGLLRFYNSSGMGEPNAAGTWRSGERGFAGVEFTQGGSAHFGWIQLEWKASSFLGVKNVPKSITAIDWAYESTPNAPIEAGAGIPPSVPEPNTAMIAWLASGCVGVLAWRKHRRQLAEKARTETAEVVPDIPRE